MAWIVKESIWLFLSLSIRLDASKRDKVGNRNIETQNKMNMDESTYLVV